MERLATHYRLRLSALYPGCVTARTTTTMPAIRFCHRLQSGEGKAWGGLSELLFDLVINRESETLHGALLFGFLSKGFALEDERLAKIVQWPGVRYLTYDATDEQLLNAGRAAIEGSMQPLPNWVEIEAFNDLLRMSSEVRHWLENRRTNVRGMLVDFRGAVRKDELSAFHLISQPAVSEQHQQTLNRLWAFDRLVSEFASANHGIGALREAIAEVEGVWSAFELSRAVCRAAVQKGALGSAEVEAVVTKLEKVAIAVSSAIQATHILDAALARRNQT